MSEFFQSGQHPDADQLSAFAEQALPAHEHQQMLAHLAHCSSCRAIAYLAEEAAAQEVTAAHPDFSPVTTVSKSWILKWFSGWNLVWTAAAALACLILVAVQLHRFSIRKSGDTTTIASDLHPSTIAPSAPQTTPAKQPIKPKGNASRGPSMNGLTQPDIDTATEPETITLSPQTGNSAILTGRDAAELVRMAPAPTASARDSSAAANPAAPMNGAAASPPAGGAVTVVSGADAEVPMDTAEVSATLNNELVDSAVLSQRPIKLPSHLLAVSMVSSGRIALAIDAAGALFASKDAGKHWEAVSPQWTGRAVQVAFVSARQPQAHAAPAAAFNKAAASSPAPAVAGLREMPQAIPIGNSTISGLVTDQTGARIRGARITLTNVDTTENRAVTTNQNGSYEIDQIVPGKYALEAIAPGFQPWRQPGIQISDSQPAIADIKLKVGGSSASVTVVTEAPAIQTDSNPVSTTLKEEQVIAWPPLFQLTTDTGAIWTSSDGRHWQRK
jgi:hypothetical protein